MNSTPEDGETAKLDEPASLPRFVGSEHPKEPLVEWARIVDEDSQSEPSDYLDESRAPHSGE